MLRNASRLLVCSVLLFASAAAAGGGKLYPGGMCSPVSLLTTELDDVVRDHDFWWAGSVNKEVMCPIVTSKLKGTKGLRLVEMRVDPAGGTLTCRLVSVRGGSTQSSGNEMVTGSGDNTIPLTLPLSLEGGSFLVRCTLPAGAKIRDYLVIE